VIKVRAPVERILVESGRAIGVRLADGTEVRAGTVISNGDPSVTYGKLLAPEHVPPRVRTKLAKTRYSVSALSLFLAIDRDPRAWGFDSGNVWFFEDDDVDGIYRRGLDGWGLEVEDLPFLFLSLTTLKDPSKRYRGHHTIEGFTLVGYDAFRTWAATAHDARPASYQALKEELTDRMLDAIDRVAPGLSEHITFVDLGTPLTNEFYCASTGGNMYGTEKTLGQMGPFSWPIRTAIRDLWMCGASTLCHGVMGSTISGLVAARSILGCSFDELLRADGGEITIASAEKAPIEGEEVAALDLEDVA